MCSDDLCDPLPVLIVIRVDDLKALLQSMTDVPPERQKILGLVKGKLPPDDETMYSLTRCISRLYQLNISLPLVPI